jgi:hypothetical protein
LKAPQSFFYIIFLLLATCFATKDLYAQIEFVENKGQWDSRVKFMSDAGSGSFFLTQNGFTVTQNNPDDMESIKAKTYAMAVKNRDADGKPVSNMIRGQAYSV